MRTCVDDDGMDTIAVWSGQEPNCVRKLLALIEPMYYSASLCVLLVHIQLL